MGPTPQKKQAKTNVPKKKTPPKGEKPNRVVPGPGGVG